MKLKPLHTTHCFVLFVSVCITLDFWAAYGTTPRTSLLDEDWIASGTHPMGGQGPGENLNMKESAWDSFIRFFAPMSTADAEKYWAENPDQEARFVLELWQSVGYSPYKHSGGVANQNAALAERFNAYQDKGKTGFFSGFFDCLGIGQIASGIGAAFVELGAAISDPVNVVNGVFYQHDVDLHLEAPVPLIITRSYLSTSWAVSDMGAAWRINHDYYLYANQAVVEMDAAADLSDTAEVRLGENDGTMLVYSRLPSDPPNLLYVNGNPDASAVVDGINNYNAAGTGAGSNLRNNYVEYKPAEGIFYVHRGDGSVRAFGWQVFPAGADESANDYRRSPYLIYERHPNGVKFVYDYNQSLGVPDYIKVTDDSEAVVYNWVRFQYNAQKRITDLIASDGRRVGYYYNAYGDLIRVVRSDHTEVSFEYEHTYSEGGYFIDSTHRIVAVRKPQGRTLINEYYTAGDIVDGEELLEDDYRIGRVQLQKAPVTTYPRPVANARFKYYENASGAGYTEVYDVLGNKLVYRYNQQKLLTDIEKYTKQGHAPGEPLLYLEAFEYERYAVEKRFWDDAGNLMTSALLDAAGVVLTCQQMAYDAAGNMLMKTEWGNLSGACLVAPVLNEIGEVVNAAAVESSSTQYTYGEYNRLTSSTAPNGLVQLFEYDPSAGNLTARYRCRPDATPGDPFDNLVYSREYYQYDDNQVLSETVTDNGTSTDRADLAGVTKRSKTEVLSGISIPEYSLPTTMRSYYWDGAAWIVRNKKTVEYNNTGQPITERVYDSNNIFQYQTEAAYDAMGRILSALDPLGNSIENKYDLNGNLVWNDGARNYTEIQDHTYYEYDFFDRPLKTVQDVNAAAQVSTSVVYDGYGNETANIDVFGNRTDLYYDDMHRLIKTVMPAVKDKTGGLYRPEASIVYDELGRVVSVTNAAGKVTSTSYNSRGRKIREVFSNKVWAEYRYNLDGTLLRQTQSTGNYTEFIYDLLERVTDAFLYDDAGVLLSRSSASYDAFQQIQTTDAEGNVTDYIYDWNGDLMVLGPEVDGKRSKIENAFDDFGRVKAVVSWFGDGASDYAKVTKQYDHLGQLIYQDLRDASGTVVQKSSSQYDAAGNLRSSKTYTEAAPYGANTVYEYNALNQLIKVVDPQGNETSTDYDYSTPDGLNGLRKTVLDANENAVIIDENALGRAVKVTRRNNDGLVLHATEQSHDAMGRLVVSTDHIYAQPGEFSKTLSNGIDYNEVGAPLRITIALGSDCERVKQYFYDAHGRLHRTALSNGMQLIRFYNENGWLRRLVSCDGTVNYEYGYTPNGWLANVDDHVNHIHSEFSYDAAGRKTMESTIVDGYEIPVKYAYDLAGRLSRTLLPGEHAVDYAYAAAGIHDVIRKAGVSAVNSSDGVEQYRHTYTSRDHAGNLLTASSSISGAMAQYSYAYDSLGRRISVSSPQWSYGVGENGFDGIGNVLNYTATDPNGTMHVENAYSDLYQLTEHAHENLNQTYTYDSIGNRLAGPASFDSAPLTYDYNELNELIAVSESGNLSGRMVQVPVNGLIRPNSISGSEIVSISVQLDDAAPVNAAWSGEEWMVEGGTIGVPADGHEHKISVVAFCADEKQNAASVFIQIDSGASASNVYDLNGNMIQKTRYLSSGMTETASYYYDALERVIRVTTPEAEINYVYDALHRRISKKITPNSEGQIPFVEYYLWSGLSEIGAFDAAMNLLQLRVLGQGMGNEIGAAIAVELRSDSVSAWSVYEPVHDQRGNIAVLLKDDGAVAESYRYDAYGNVNVYNAAGSAVINERSEIGNPWMFAAKRRDPETGLIYFGRRYYDSASGRFITTDPAGFADGPNLYGYVKGNPMMYIDPDGRLAKSSMDFIADSASDIFNPLLRMVMASKIGEGDFSGKGSRHNAFGELLNLPRSLLNNLDEYRVRVKNLMTRRQLDYQRITVTEKYETVYETQYIFNKHNKIVGWGAVPKCKVLVGLEYSTENPSIIMYSHVTGGFTSGHAGVLTSTDGKLGTWIRRANNDVVFQLSPSVSTHGMWTDGVQQDGREWKHFLPAYFGGEGSYVAANFSDDMISKNDKFWDNRDYGNASWRVLNPCSAPAVDCWANVVGENLYDRSWYVGPSTPSEVAKNISAHARSYDDE